MIIKYTIFPFKMAKGNKNDDATKSEFKSRGAVKPEDPLRANPQKHNAAMVVVNANGMKAAASYVKPRNGKATSKK